jgi:hypothetical protein
VERLKCFAVLLSSLLLNSSKIEATLSVSDVTAAVSDFHLVPMNGIVDLGCEGCLDKRDCRIVGRVKR